MCARDLVSLGLEGQRLGLPLPSKKRREAVDGMLQAVDAEPFADQRIGELSGGQQQRVLIAHALVRRPSVPQIPRVNGLNAAYRDRPSSNLSGYVAWNRSDPPRFQRIVDVLVKLSPRSWSSRLVDIYRCRVARHTLRFCPSCYAKPVATL
ncbi:ATP-binding cassette domain-containing protein [Paraburkholderia kirstenboschensis]|uniref:ATP-binding cassette domain-containing protein n=1 Tax=Paraburkholderia kirstenboschensis TaxID=1245436 RepID=UPI0022A8933A|nr:ATP-binding cassette domain-containing protein [Paraburkholderia kirstenboschensis]